MAERYFQIGVRLDVNLRRKYEIPDSATDAQAAAIKERIDNEMIEAAGDFIAMAVVNGKYEVVGTCELLHDGEVPGHMFSLAEPGDA